jgi:hypothetical protein
MDWDAHTVWQVFGHVMSYFVPVVFLSPLPLRVMRFLLLLRDFSGVSSFLNAIYDSVRALFRIFAALALLFLVCALAGMRLFSGTLSAQCVCVLRWCLVSA